ncbi:hypothetical protein FQR65_LT14818 [Abscondita terminalis]|nr:hypothetical protein FQR65_LT14818 [Abscondita terminalis]
MEKSIPILDPTLEEIKKIIKQENIMNSGRLQSLRLPKELNLGGTKPKKVYTPNLNAIRNKDKQNLITRPNRNHKNSHHRSLNNAIKRENKRPKYIQPEGVFSQGIGEVKRPQNVECPSTNKDYKNSLTIPKLNKKDKEIVGIPLDIKLLVDNKSDAESESENEYDPIMLPLWKNNESFAKSFKIKQEFPVKIKCEDGINENISTASKSSYEFDKTKIKIEKFEGNNAQTAFMDETKEFDEDNPAFSLLQVYF